MTTEQKNMPGTEEEAEEEPKTAETPLERTERHYFAASRDYSETLRRRSLRRL